MGDVIAQCASLLEQEFGPDYVRGAEEYVRTYADRSGWQLYVHEETEPSGQGPETVVHAVADSAVLPDVNVAGFFIIGRVGKAELREQAPVDDICDHLPYGSHRYPVTLLKMTVVRSEWEKRGVGWRLGMAALEHYGDKQPYVGLLRDRADDDREGHIRNLSKVGGRQVARFESLAPPGYRCPSCGFDSECRCDLLVYVVDGIITPSDRQTGTVEPVQSD